MTAPNFPRTSTLCGLRLTLSDGAPVVIRPIAPEDKPQLVDGLRRASPETVYRRFLVPKRSFSAAELRYLTEVDGHDHIALVAIDARDGVMIAIGRCVRTAPDTAEMAIVVDDPWQGRGLGRRLATLLAEAAAGEGIERISGTMLAGNRRAMRLMRGLGTRIELDEISHGVREAVARLAA